MTSQVYFIRVADNGPVKIGRSIDPVRRMRTLQIGFAGRLSIIRVSEGDGASETAMHRRFASRRIAGEWFHFSPEMLTVAVPPIGMQSAFEDDRDEDTQPMRSAADDFMTALLNHHYAQFRFAQRRLAADAGTLERSARNWLRGVNMPQASSLLHIIVANPKFGKDIIEFTDAWRGEIEEAASPLLQFKSRRQ